MLVPCWFNVGSMLVQCWFNVGSMLVQCWFNVGSMMTSKVTVMNRNIFGYHDCNMALCQYLLFYFPVC